MATYKVLQDIEAEDTLVGPLTLRQCIYAAIAVVGIYLSVVFVTKGVPFMIIFSLPFVAFGVFFAFPWTKQQTTEVWALAKVRFYLKPRKRIWDQTGAKDLVTITVPKAVKRAYSSSLSPTEVESRLKALADTIDSRGWAVKNVDLGYFTKPSLTGQSSTDRLILPSNLPQDVPAADPMASEDIFDVHNNPVAQKLNAMMGQQAGQYRQQIMLQMAQPAPAAGQAAGTAQTAQGPQPATYWNMPSNEQADLVPQQPAPAPRQPGTLPAPVDPYAPSGAVAATPTPTPTPTPYAPAIAAAPAAPTMPASQPAPAAAAPLPIPPAPAANSGMTGQTKPAILELANNNDLDIATIAREAQVRNPEPPEEVSISLR